MTSLTCSANTPRAVKARLASRFDNTLVRWLLVFLILLFLVTGSWLIFTGSRLGYLSFIPSSVLVCVLLWYYGELRQLPATEPLSSVTDISNVLSRRLLAKLGTHVTPKQLASIVSKQPGGYFFAARFSIGSNDLGTLSADDEGSTALVWDQAIKLAQRTGSREIDSGIIAGAVILAIPEIEPRLAAASLDRSDIVNGVDWFVHIRRMMERASIRRHYGGIGRDLSFGWAPLLNQVGFNITDSIQRGSFLLRPVSSRQQIVGQVIRLLAQQGRRNAVLVGEPGVGKTTVIYSLAHSLLTDGAIPKEVAYQQIISLNASTLLARTTAKGQIEELLIRIFNEAIHAKNVIIFLDEAQLFLQPGTGSVDLSNLLLPIIEGGRLKIILAMNDQEWLRLSQANPGLAQLLNRVIIKPLDREETIQVVEDELVLMEAKNKLVYTYQSIGEAYRLADRFIHEQAFPGKALKLLEAAANFPEDTHFITANSVQKAAEKSFDVKVQAASSDSERETLLSLEQKIHQRMINQSRAVRLVSDALRRARSGVRSQNKPIGTFLFLGPTGVGKTELSKALADVYFGGEDRMVRVDLNEFSRAEDTSRLLAAGADDPHSLCAQIAKRPFSVVLLDEIEKAHPNVLNLLLQMLDEGTLRDSANKPVSFIDTIIICTSNAGAERIRQHIDAGETLEQFESQFVDELIGANIFRPEFLNRFDEIVLFRPLNREELLQVVDLLMVRLNKTLADRKVVISLTSRAKELMVERGYDPRLGARPLRRVMQRAVENLVAQKLLSGQISPGHKIQIDAPELHNILEDR